MTTVDLELALGNLRHALARDEERQAGSEEEAGRVLALCERHRQLACGVWLADLDVEGFRRHLLQGARAYLGLLREREGRPGLDAYALCASRALPLVDALAGGHGGAAREVAERMTPRWTRRMEPRADFLFFHALGGLARGEEVAGVLDEASGAGLESPRFDVLRALAAGDVRAFESALEARVDEWQGELEQQRRREALPPEAASTEAHVCLEAVALLHLARGRGLRAEVPPRYVPPEVVPPLVTEVAP
jgi:hypothetical protein